MKRYTAVIKILTAGIGWGMIGLFVRGLQSAGISGIQITALRVFVTAACMAVFLLVKDRRLFKIKPADMRYFFGTGVCSILFFNVCYFTAIRLTSLSVSAILLYTAPAIVMLFSVIFMGERLTVKKAAALVLSFAGCCLVCGIAGDSAANTELAGILAGLGSGFGYALYSIIGGFALKKYSPYTVTAYTFFTAALFAVPICRPVQLASTVINRPELFAYILPLGIICTFIPFLLYTEGLSFLEAGNAAILASIEPVTAAVISVAVFKEALSPAAALGIAAVLAAIALLSLPGKQKNR